MLPCTLRDARTTVLVVPLVALRVNLSRRLREGGVTYAEWSVEQPGVALLVLVSMEAAATDDFLAWARHLHDTQQLDRIVIDECHLTVTAALRKALGLRMTAWRPHGDSTLTSQAKAYQQYIYLVHRFSAE